MSTRATLLASRRAKQKLVSLLFDPSKNKNNSSMCWESHEYSYLQLKSAYLARLQQVHPDKHHNNADSTNNTNWHDEFVTLQNAWDQYQTMALIMNSTSTKQTNFSMFGVGCSFSDSPRERELRTEITNQACRGWFSSGSLLQETNPTATQTKEESSTKMSLCDEDMFVVQEEEEASIPTSSRRFLVDPGPRMKRSQKP